MNARTTELDTDKLRQDILEAARARFSTYGISKTTMAEIAEDVSMSAANLYRYFKNKQDIAVNCADECMCSCNKHLKNVVRQRQLTASQRLLTFALETHKFNRDMVKGTPKLYELIEHVAHHKPEFIHKIISDRSALIAETLAHGNETGEFSVNDVIGKAETIYSTFLLFDVPIFLPLFSVEEFERKANHIVELIVDSVRKR